MFVQAINDVVWAEQLTEFEADDTSRKFRDFLCFWVDTAEKLILTAGPETDIPTSDEIHRHTSKALEIAEQTLGFLSVEWISQMLLVLIQHWAHGEALLHSLTFIEHRLVQQATAMKLVDLQVSASIPIAE